VARLRHTFQIIGAKTVEITFVDTEVKLAGGLQGWLDQLPLLVVPKLPEWLQVSFWEQVLLVAIGSLWGASLACRDRKSGCSALPLALAQPAHGSLPHLERVNAHPRSVLCCCPDCFH
jgi:hypothetical protein